MAQLSKDTTMKCDSKSQALLCWQSVIVGGMQDDRSTLVFAVPGEISLYIRQECL